MDFRMQWYHPSSLVGPPVVCGHNPTAKAASTGNRRTSGLLAPGRGTIAPKSEEKSDENLISFRDWYRSHRASHQPVAESDIIELGASGTWDGWSVRPADVPSRVVFGFQMLVHQVDRAKDGWYYEADSSLESLLDQCMEAKDPVAHIVHWDLNRFSNLNDFALHCLGHAADEGSPAANYIRWTCKPTPESEYETESEYSYESEPELVDRIESK
eukprot:500633_1